MLPQLTCRLYRQFPDKLHVQQVLGGACTAVTADPGAGATTPSFFDATDHDATLVFPADCNTVAVNTCQSRFNISKMQLFKPIETLHAYKLTSGLTGRFCTDDELAVGCYL